MKRLIRQDREFERTMFRDKRQKVMELGEYLELVLSDHQ